MDKEEINVSNEQSLMNDFNKVNTSILTRNLLIALIAVILLGVGSGYILNKKGENIAKIGRGGQATSSDSTGIIVGSSDTKTFKDTAEGVLKKGGIDGEGAYHLVRPGGESQNVYLTSSTVDLSKFVGKKIRVRGETQKAKVAGWLMDVGRVEVLK